MTTDPTWKWPPLFASQAGAEVVHIPIYGAENGWRLTPEKLRAACDGRTAVIYLVDPNNPLGSCHTADEIRAFAAIARDCGALLVHDCTYRDFATGHHPALLEAPEHAVVSLSFSKWLGLAGLRIGALVTPPGLLEEFAGQATGVLGASVLAQRAALAGLAVKPEWMAEVRRIDTANKARIREAALAIGMAVPVWPSHGNFIVIETGALRPAALAEAARREGLMIRAGAYHTAQFGDRFIKVSTTVPEAWAARLADRLPALAAAAAQLNDLPPQF